MKALAIIPWYSTDPWRIRSMRYVTENLDKLGIEFILSTGSQGDTFNRAAAKNAGARTAEYDGFDTLIFHDADMLLHDWEYETLVKTAYEEEKLVIGFNEYRPLTQPGTAQTLDGMNDNPWVASTGNVTVGFSLGGIVAIRVDCFNEVGGYDERFRGWGCEDFAFAIASGVVLGPWLRLNESAVHLYHEHAITVQSDDDSRWNTQLLTRYNQLTSVEELRALQVADLTD